jgi:hypothetical protein
MHKIERDEMKILFFAVGRTKQLTFGLGGSVSRTWKIRRLKGHGNSPSCSRLNTGKDFWPRICNSKVSRFPDPLDTEDENCHTISPVRSKTKVGLWCQGVFGDSKYPQTQECQLCILDSDESSRSLVVWIVTTTNVRTRHVLNYRPL